MLSSSSLHTIHLYIFASLHTHQYALMCALYIYIFFLSDISIFFPLSYISCYTSLRSRAIRRLVFIFTYIHSFIHTDIRVCVYGIHWDLVGSNGVGLFESWKIPSIWRIHGERNHGNPWNKHGEAAIDPRVICYTLLLEPWPR